MDNKKLEVKEETVVKGEKNIKSRYSFDLLIVGFSLSLAVISFIFAVVCAKTLNENIDRLDRLEAQVDSVTFKVDKKNSVASSKKHDVIHEKTDKKSDISIDVISPKNKYEFTEEKTCSEFSVENDLWYAWSISPYISPGVEADVYLRGDYEKDHYIKAHVINTTDEDISESSCSMFGLSVRGIEGWAIGGIAIGSSTKDIIERLGTPDSFTISGYDVVSSLTYIYGNYEVYAIADTLRGEVYYIEVVCKDYNAYRNGVLEQEE